MINAQEKDFSKNIIHLQTTIKKWAPVFLIILLGILLRWPQLGIRAFHHDEALYAIYGKYFYLDPFNKYYKYHPMLHGPLLYHILPWIYAVFDTTKWSARLISTCLGTFFLFTPFIFRRKLQYHTVLILTLIISLSPSLTYWSRFLRHDLLVIFSIFIMLWGYLLSSYKYKSFFILTGISLHFCIKENFYITLFILSTFIFFEWLNYKISNIKNTLTGEKEKILLHKAAVNISKHPKIFITSVFIAYFIFCYFYTAGFKYSAGILDGLYRKSIGYWFHQHSIERIKGPLIYHFFSLCWYDFIFIILLFIHLIHFYLKASWRYRLPFIISLIFSFLLHKYYNYEALELHPLWGNLRLKIGLDFYPLILIPVHAVAATLFHFKQGKNQLAFWSYSFFSTFFIYNYVGEKVPWLTLYPLFTGIVYLSLYFEANILIDRFFSIKIPKTKVMLVWPLLIFVIIFNLRLNIITNFSQAGNPSEFIGQVHTTTTYENIIFKIKDKILNPLNGYRPKVLGHQHAWPITWYLYELPEYSFRLNKDPISKFDYIFTEKKGKSLDKIKNEVKVDYRIISIPFRGWWAPNYKKITFLKFFNYVINHIPWNAPGHQEITYFVKKNK